MGRFPWHGIYSACLYQDHHICPARIIGGAHCECPCHRPGPIFEPTRSAHHGLLWALDRARSYRGLRFWWWWARARYGRDWR